MLLKAGFLWFFAPHAHVNHVFPRAYVLVCVLVSRYKADQAFLVGQDKSPVGAYLDVEVRMRRGTAIF